MTRTDRQARAAGRAGADRRPVLFVHGSLSSGGMWKPYGRALADRYDARTPDLSGYGARPAWPVDTPFHLTDETAVLAEAVRDITVPFDIVAHSYGGLVALRFAFDHPGRVRSLTLFEPTVFRVLADPDVGSPGEHAEITWVARTVREGVELGAPDAAMSHFVDYWNGHGAWRTLPHDRRRTFIAQAATVARNFAAGAGDDMPIASLRELRVPTLMVAGSRSTRASLVTSWTLAALLPRAESITVAHAGHMMPLTHADDSLRLVSGWLDNGNVTPRIAA